MFFVVGLGRGELCPRRAAIAGVGFTHAIQAHEIEQGRGLKPSDVRSIITTQKRAQRPL